MNLSLDKKSKEEDHITKPTDGFREGSTLFNTKEILKCWVSGKRLGETGHFGEKLLVEKVRTNSKLIATHAIEYLIRTAVTLLGGEELSKLRHFPSYAV